MIFDPFILVERSKVVQDLPWPIPALVVMQMTPEDLDRLGAAEDKDEYWRILNGIVHRIEGDTR